ncbi:MAG: hypothetical protein U0836_15965 [Pirellulales bacterium]
MLLARMYPVPQMYVGPVLAIILAALVVGLGAAVAAMLRRR